MNTSLLGPIAVAVLVPIILGFLFRSPNQTARDEHGTRWLEYGRVMKGVALIFAGLVSLLIGLWFIVTPENKIPVAWMVALFGLLDLPLLIEFFGVRIGFDDSQIYCHSGWRKSRVVPWAEIKSCNYSPTNKWWVLETRNQGNIRIHEFLSGRESFFDVMEERTGIGA